MAKKYIVRFKKEGKIIKTLYFRAVGGWLQEVENLANRMGATYLLAPYNG
jgi:3'-phosphoadenosine 5'-phosphosulfate sulfotransferase